MSADRDIDLLEALVNCYQTTRRHRDHSILYINRRTGQITCPIFKGQEAQKSSTSWLNTGPISCTETSALIYHSALYNTPEERNFIHFAAQVCSLSHSLFIFT